MTTQKQRYINGFVDTFWLFLAGAGLGWLYEVILQLFQSRGFVNRGMLHGPWLPIYGVGGLLMVGLKYLAGDRPICYFISCVAASAILEYGTSWVMEAVYHTRWWDYSDLPLNLNGRIFVGGLIGFGLAGCLFSYLLLPRLAKLYGRMPLSGRKMLAIGLAFVFALDIVASLIFPNMGFGITHP